MTETRRQIISLIEPYMDKTLSDGCYFITNGVFNNNDGYIGKFKDADSEDVFIADIYNLDSLDNTGVIIYKSKNVSVLYNDFDTDEWSDDYGYIDYSQGEILGHYDITAVLKYIESINCSIYIDKHIIFYPKENIASPYGLPNKPLHLYTKQEERHLLDLLLKLK